MVFNLAEDNTNMFIPSMKRMWWGAIAPKWRVPNARPLTHARLTHTGTQPCTTNEECCGFIKTIQNFYMTEVRLTDIPYNFIIGGDGVVYKGRGWFSEPALPPNLQWLSSKCLDVAFVGNYEDKEPDATLMKLALDLITYGVKSRKLQLDYTLIKLGESPKMEL